MQPEVRLVFVGCAMQLPLPLFVFGYVLVPESVSTTSQHLVSSMPTFPRRFFSLLYWQTYSSSNGCQPCLDMKSVMTYQYTWSKAPVLQCDTVSVCLSCRSNAITIATSTHAVAMIARSADPSLNCRGASALHLGHLQCRGLHRSYVNRWNVDSIRSKRSVWGKTGHAMVESICGPPIRALPRSSLRIWTLVGKEAVLSRPVSPAA